MDTKELLGRAQEYVELEQDPRFRDEVKSLIAAGDLDSLNDRFYTSLAFGTGGLRGMIGGGFNRMNPYVVRRATQGLADYVRFAAESPAPKAVIAYDSRRYSALFAEEAALVLCANGIKTYLFSSLRPTPELSFAVRRLAATTGIVVTASHNPPAYNGYKVYWSDGAQIIPPHDEAIIARVRAVARDTRAMSREEATAKGLLVLIDREIDDPFIAMVKSYILRPQLVREKGAGLKVVYTPLHGAGRMPIERSLSELGFRVVTVPEQAEPDGEFPTVQYPNPEEASALKLAIELARRERADLVMASDPDSDRLGIAVPQGGDFVLVTGNQLGALLADYILSSRRELGRLPAKPVFIKTIVTTNLQARIAESYGAKVYNVLTGFKYIAEKIRLFESSGEGYVFGGEESYGYLVETEVRDKDAVSAAVATAEMALYQIAQGKSLLDRLHELYERHGYFEERQISRGFAGESGREEMGRLMDRLRSSPPRALGGVEVALVKDYGAGTTLDLRAGSSDTDIDLPSSNVLQFVLADESIVTARPSGTEPKIKFYASCCARPGTALAEAKREVGARMRLLEEEIDRIIAGS